MASGDTLITFLPRDNEMPASSPATFVLRNGIWVLAFDGAVSESAVFRDFLPSNYAGGGLTLHIYWVAKTAVTGDVVWGASIERAQDGGTDIDTDSFAAEQTSTAVTTNATSGVKNKSTITFTSGANMDSLAANEPFRLKLSRKTADAGDTMSTDDAQVVELHVRET